MTRNLNEGYETAEAVFQTVQANPKPCITSEDTTDTCRTEVGGVSERPSKPIDESDEKPPTVQKN